jgi:hypothetical protein
VVFCTRNQQLIFPATLPPGQSSRLQEVHLSDSGLCVTLLFKGENIKPCRYCRIRVKY